MTDLAHEILNEETKEGGGVYVFDNINDANRYATKHTKRLEAFGFSDIRTKIFEINEVLSAINKITFYMWIKKKRD